jgi:preprotein translocase subunit Sec63
MKERQNIYRFAFVNRWLILKISFISILWFFLFRCYEAIKDVEEIKGFVPHEILGVRQDAILSEIKRAYRKLSKEKHPDKNPDNPAAVQDFIEITKAYTVSP